MPGLAVPREEGRGPFRGWPHGTVSAAAFQEGSGSAPAVQGTALPCWHLPEKAYSWKGAQGQSCPPGAKRLSCVGREPPAPPHEEGRPPQLPPAPHRGQKLQPPSLHLSATHRATPPIHPLLLLGNPFPSIHPPLTLRNGDIPSSPIPLCMEDSPHPTLSSPPILLIRRRAPITPAPALLPLQRPPCRLLCITPEEWMAEVSLPHNLIPHSAPKLPAQGKLHPAPPPPAWAYCQLPPTPETDAGFLQRRDTAKQVGCGRLRVRRHPAQLSPCHATRGHRASFSCHSAVFINLAASGWRLGQNVAWLIINKGETEKSPSTLSAQIKRSIASESPAAFSIVAFREQIALALSSGLC